MTALLLMVAMAQDSLDRALGAPCDPLSPIAGTAGFTNGLAAIRTNAQTYGAGEFARRRLRGGSYMVFDQRIVLGIARVPTYCIDGEAKRSGEVFDQPLDVGSTNLGLNIPVFEDETALHMSLRLFYASSVTTSTMGNRVFTSALPLLNLYPAAFAPLVGVSTSGGSLSTLAVDWIGGATFKSDVVSVQTGYTGTRGLYLDVTQEKIAIFFNTAFQGDFNLSNAAYVIAGVQRFDPLNVGLPTDVAKKTGLTSVFYRRLPQTESVDTGGQRNVLQQLRTGHLRQEDIAEVFDIRGSWQLGPQANLRELAVAGHTPNWNPREFKSDRIEPAGYVRAGILNLPDQPLFGVRGGMRPTVRAVYKVVNKDGAGLVVSGQMNDPELLDLYPFAYNAFGISVELSMDGS